MSAAHIHLSWRWNILLLSSGRGLNSLRTERGRCSFLRVCCLPSVRPSVFWFFFIFFPAHITSLLPSFLSRGTSCFSSFVFSLFLSLLFIASLYQQSWVQWLNTWSYFTELFWMNVIQNNDSVWVTNVNTEKPLEVMQKSHISISLHWKIKFRSKKVWPWADGILSPSRITVLACRHCSFRVCSASGRVEIIWRRPPSLTHSSERRKKGY